MYEKPAIVVAVTRTGRERERGRRRERENRGREGAEDARDKERETAAGILNDTRTERKMDARFAGRGEGIFFYYSSRDTLLIDKRLEDECTCAWRARGDEKEGRKNSAANVQ